MARAVVLIGGVCGVFAVLAGLAFGGTAESASECQPLAGLRQDALSTAAVDRGSGSETTQFLRGGAYEVTRCDADGQVTISEVVAPIEAPGGERVMVPMSETTRVGDAYADASMTYGPPDNPGWQKIWADQGATARASVIPPTKDSQ